MKIRTIITAALIAFACSAAAAAAESIPVVETAEDGICVSLSGSISLYDFGYNDAQIRDRVPYSPLLVSVVISEPETGEIVYANQVTASEDGAYSMKFILGAEDGEYNVKIYTAYCKVYEGVIEYNDAAVERFNETAQTGNTEELEAFVRGYAAYIGLDLSKYKQFTAEEQAGVLMQLAKKAPYDTKADICAEMSEAVFNAGLTTVTLSDEEKTQMLNEYIGGLGDDYAEIGEFVSGNAIETAVIKDFNKGGYDSVADGLYELAMKAYIDNCIDNIYDLEALFQNNLFSIPDNILKEYTALSQKTAFFTELNKRTSAINTLEDFYDAVGNSADAAKNTSKPSTGSSGGGGGGGGGTATYTAPVKAPESASKTEDADKPGTGTADNEKELSFSDLEDYGWAEAEIYELARRGVVSGDGSGGFKPGESIKREEFVKILAGAFGVEADGDGAAAFEDVGENDWYYEAVTACAANHIVNGISASEFGVGLPITRQEAAALLARILDIENAQNGGAQFADDGDIADYAKNSVYNLKDRGVINGYDDNTFKPDYLLTRAEAAKMICKAMQLRGEV